MEAWGEQSALQHTDAARLRMPVAALGNTWMLMVPMAAQESSEMWLQQHRVVLVNTEKLRLELVKHRVLAKLEAYPGTD